MSRLIDADAIIIDLLDRGIEGVQTDDYTEFQHIFEDAPTVDAVAVCRCKDCKHGIEEDGGIKCVASADYDEMSNDLFGFVSWHEQEWFCADGERKGKDE